MRVRIDYTNWRGERRLRMVIPLKIWYGSTEFHPSFQWLLRARDDEDGVVKDFAMSGIHCWAC